MGSGLVKAALVAVNAIYPRVLGERRNTHAILKTYPRFIPVCSGNAAFTVSVSVSVSVSSITSVYPRVLGERPP